MEVHSDRGGSVTAALQESGAAVRTSEPILLNAKLPAPAPARSHMMQQQSKSSGSSTHSASSSSLPVRPMNNSMSRLGNLTPIAHITEQQKTALKEAAEARIVDMLTRAQAAWDGTDGIFEDPTLWKLHMSKPHVSAYRRHSKSAVQSHPFVITGRVPGLTLEDLQYGLYADTTPDERAVIAFWFGNFFLDAAVLEAFETQTEDDRFRFFGIKWQLAGALGGVKQLLTPRDNAFMEYTKTVTSALGEKILVKVEESVPETIVPFIPDQGDLRFMRSEFLIVYMYHYDVKANEVQVFCEGSINPAGRARGFMANLNLSLFAPVVVHLDHIAEAKFITKHGLLFPHDHADAGKMSMALSVSTHIPSPLAASASAESFAAHLTSNWVPDHQRKACYVCFKSFGLLRRHRHHCRMCGEVICSQCTMTLPLVAPPAFDAEEDAHFPLQNQPAKKRLEDSNRHGFPVVNRVKLCKKCILLLRQERRAMVAGVGDYYFTEGMLRHREQMQAAFAGKYVPPFRGDDDGASGFRDDDESIADSVEYSRQVEQLRQEHMEREKQKLRDHQQQQQRSGTASDVSPSVQLLNDEEVASIGAPSRKLSIASSELSFNYDNLILTDPRAFARLTIASASDTLSATTSTEAGGTTAPRAGDDSSGP